MSTANIKEVVKEKYGQAALRVQSGGSSCCGGRQATACECDPITSDLYSPDQTTELPAGAVQASLGCGNPTALAELKPGEVVLDLGSGGGIDVLLSARRVGATGKAYGLDMTDEMLDLARENQRKAGVSNVEFLKGEIENIPLPDNTVDVVISNCVVNLSADKDRVLREAFRVLRPGGRFAVSDVVVHGSVPDQIRKNVELWIGCIAGALQDEDYRSKLVHAGFEGISIEPTRVYNVEDARQFLTGQGIDVDEIAPQVAGKFMSAFIRGSKTRGLLRTELLRRGMSSILQVNISPGGIPKRPIAEAVVTVECIRGDSWSNPQVHGGPNQAVLIITSEGIAELVAQGFPLYSGALGENLTTSGLDRRQMRIGQRYRAGEVMLELTKLRAPCSNLDVYGPSIKQAIYDAQVKAGDPASPRWGLGGFYARVIRPGVIRPHDIITLVDQVV